MERAVNIRAYARELQSLLDTLLKEVDPDQYQRVQNEIGFQAGDSVHIGKDLAWQPFGVSMPHVLNSAFADGATEVTVAPALLERVGITNYEQLRMQGATNFSVTRAKESQTQERVNSP